MKLPFLVSTVALVVLAALRSRALLTDPGERRDGHITVCACALALVPLALTAVRNVPPFLMLAVPVIATLVPGVFTARSISRERPRLNAAMAGAAAAFADVAVLGAYKNRLARFNWSPLPAASVTALDCCQGNVYNRYDEGGYLIWFAPGRKVFLDGRQDLYPLEPPRIAFIFAAASACNAMTMCVLVFTRELGAGAGSCFAVRQKWSKRSST